jgi:hypothetical protein
VQDDTSQLILLVSGSVEYVTECDDNEFVMKILEAGSIINPRNVIIDELMYVDIRCRTNVTTMVLENESLMEVKMMFPALERTLNIHWNDMNRNLNTFPFDWIAHD